MEINWTITDGLLGKGTETFKEDVMATAAQIKSVTLAYGCLWGRQVTRP